MSSGLASLEFLATEPPPVSDAGAAVVALLRSSANGLEVLLIERTRRKEDPWSGQVSLPGGRTEADDRSLTETALRELEEEVGISRSRLLAPARFFRTFPTNRARLRVAVFVAELAEPEHPPAVAPNSEVAAAFWLPLSQLAHSEPTTWPLEQGPIAIEAVLYEGHVLWGFTRAVLLTLAELLGREFSDGRDPNV